MSKFLTLEGRPTRRVSLMETLIAGLGETPAQAAVTAAEKAAADKAAEDAYVVAQRAIHDRAYDDMKYAFRHANSDGDRAQIRPVSVGGRNEYGENESVMYEPTRNYRGETVSSNADGLFRKMYNEKVREVAKQKGYEAHVTSLYTSTAGPSDAAKLPSNLPPGAGVEPGRYGSGGGIFQSYGMGEALAAQGLDGFSFKRAFTPPRAVRNVIRRVFKPVARIFKPPQFLKKAIRYAGAVATLPYTAFAGRQRNKMFGLKGNELKVFDIGAKLHRTAQIAVAVVVTGGVLKGAMVGAKAGAIGAKAGALGAGKVGAAGAVKAGAVKAGAAGVAKAGTAKLAVGGMSKAGAAKLGASLTAKGMSFGAKHSVLAFLGKTAVGAALVQVGTKLLVKDSKGGSLWSVGADAAGNVIASQFDKNSVSAADYASLPDNKAMLIPPSEDGGNSSPARSGGGFSANAQSGIPESGMAPSTAGASAVVGYNDDEPVENNDDAITVASDSEREANGAVNPLDDTEHNAKIAAFDEASIESFKDSSAPEDAPSILDEQSDSEATDMPLSCDFERALGQVRSRQAKRINTARQPKPAALWSSLL